MNRYVLQLDGKPNIKHPSSPLPSIEPILDAEFESELSMLSSKIENLEDFCQQIRQTLLITPLGYTSLGALVKDFRDDHGFDPIERAQHFGFASLYAFLTSHCMEGRIELRIAPHGEVHYGGMPMTQSEKELFNKYLKIDTCAAAAAAGTVEKEDSDHAKSAEFGLAPFPQQLSDVFVPLHPMANDGTENLEQKLPQVLMECVDTVVSCPDVQDNVIVDKKKEEPIACLDQNAMVDLEALAAAPDVGLVEDMAAKAELANIPTVYSLMKLPNASWCPKRSHPDFRIVGLRARLRAVKTDEDPTMRYVFSGGAPNNLLHGLTTAEPYSLFSFFFSGDNEYCYECQLFYYELLVLQLPKSGQVAVGFSSAGAKFESQYRCFRSNGNTQSRKGLWQRSGQSFGQSDVVGIGLIVPLAVPMNGDVGALKPHIFFTVNGVAGKHYPVSGHVTAVWPCVGICAPGTMVKANFGNNRSRPFVYNIHQHTFQN